MYSLRLENIYLEKRVELICLATLCTENPILKLRSKLLSRIHSFGHCSPWEAQGADFYDLILTDEISWFFRKVMHLRRACASKSPWTLNYIHYLTDKCEYI